MSKTITLASKRDDAQYTWTGEEDRHTFPDLPHGEYDIVIEESGYKTKVDVINHQGENTYQFTLESTAPSGDTDVPSNDTEDPWGDSDHLELASDQFTVDGRYVFTKKPISKPITKVEIQGDSYLVTSQRDMDGGTRLALNLMPPIVVNSSIVLYTTA